MINENYKPRFSFEITEAQKERADRVLFTYGLRKAVFGQILDDVLDLVETYGGVALGVIMSGKIKPRDVLPTLKEAEKKGKK